MKKQKLKKVSPYLARWRVSEIGYRMEQRSPVTENELLTLRPHIGGESRERAESKPVLPGEFLHGTWLVIDTPVPAERESADTYLTMVYDPLEEVGLHRAFASIEFDGDGLVPAKRIEEFAERFGFLGRRTERLPHLSVRQPQTWGEAYVDWLAEVIRMKALVQLWDLYRDARPDALDETDHPFIVTNSSASLRWATESVAGVFMEVRDYESSLAELPPIADPLVRRRLAARILLRDAVNEELAAGADAAIDVKAGTQVVLIPRDLRGAMYVQFARELIGQSVPPLVCEACGAYFIPRHGRQKYCEDRCRFKRYRRNKKDKTGRDNGN